jgi:hypothetical protein
MPGWIIAAALGSIAITAILTFVLWRMNLPMLERNKREGDGSGGVIADGGSSGRRDADQDGTNDSGSDGGGGDGGGD